MWFSTVTKTEPEDMAVVARKQHGTVHVYNGHLLSDLSASAGSVASTAPKHDARDAAPVTVADMLRDAPYGALAGLSAQQRAAWQHAQALHAMRSEAATEHSEAVAAMKEAKQRQELADDQMLQDVFAGMASNNGITKDCSETVAMQRKVKLKKQIRLYRDWKSSVHDTIQKRIRDAMQNNPIEQLEARLRQAFHDYISTSNAKNAAVFRDVIIEADYNPMKYADMNIRVNTSDIRDPVKLDILKPLREKALMGAQAERSPSGKAVLSPLLWDRLECTPYGRNMDPDGNYIVKPADERLSELQKSHIPMDHYSFPRDRQAVDSEMPKGKSTKQHKTKGRVEFFEIIQRVDEMAHQSQLKAQGKADGDAWLGYRGRKVPPGPEMRRGRQSLFDVMRHSCAEDLRENPTFTGIHFSPIINVMPESCSRTMIRGLDVPLPCRRLEAPCKTQPAVGFGSGGDAWLEKKGKARVTGPEQRRGRQGLFETIQQSSNPYLDGRTLDDMFLEARGKSAVPHTSQKDMFRLHHILQDRDIAVAVPSGVVKPQQVSQLVTVDGSLTTCNIPSLKHR